MNYIRPGAPDCNFDCMGANKKRIPRQRLEELLWLQCAHIEGLTEKIQLLRKQNDLLRTVNQQLREQAGLVPKVKRYPNSYAKRSCAKADTNSYISSTEG